MDEERRIVTLHSAPEVHRTVDQFFDRLGAHLDERTAAYPRAVLDQIERFVVDLCATMEAYIAARSDERPGE